jgi:hypothetical protein
LSIEAKIKKNGICYQGMFKHLPWKLVEANILKLDNQFTQIVTSDVKEVVGVSYAKETRVSFQNFKRL